MLLVVSRRGKPVFKKDTAVGADIDVECIFILPI